MKILNLMACLFIPRLASCSSTSQSKDINPSIITVEVTRIVQIASTSTIDIMDQNATAVAGRIGTPIVANNGCYKTAQTQSDLNVCAGTRLKELKSQMGDLLTAIEKNYQERLPERLENFQTFHKEWEDFSNSECLFRSGLESDWAGSTARMNYSECMIVKYEDRLREYQIQLFEWTQ